MSLAPLYGAGLEEASRLYFGESNVEGMLNTLLPLHEMLEKAGPTTLKEIAFVQSYGRELSEAYEWLMKYKASRKEAELHQVRPRAHLSSRPVLVASPAFPSAPSREFAAVCVSHCRGARALPRCACSARRPGTCTTTCSSASTSSCTR